MSEILLNDFPLKYNYRNYTIEFISLFEINQGGPMVGTLLINDKNLFFHKYFGGPLIFNSNFVYGPLLFRSFLNSGFKLCQINLSSNNLKIIGPKEDIILIEKIENNSLYYFTNVSNSMKKKVEINY